MKTPPRVYVAFAGAVLLVVLAATGTFRAFTHIGAAAQERKQAFVVIACAGELLSALEDAESGHRGYALTGDESYLEPWRDARDRLGGDLQALQTLSRTEAALPHLAALHPLLEAKVAELSRVVALRRDQVNGGVPVVFGADDGKRLLDAIRAEVGAIVRIEQSELEKHDLQFQRTMRQLFGFILAANLIALLLAAGFAWLIKRGAARRLNQGVLLETKHLLDLQQATNRELERINITLLISEQKLGVTLQSIGDGVIATDPEGRVTLLNPVAEKLTGWSQAEALRRPVEDIFNIINQETRAPSTIPVKATLEHGTVQGLANHTVLISRDGSECSIADSCAPIREPGGEVVGAVLVFRDVSKEETTRQALRDGGALVQAILNTVADGIITLQAADGVIERVNPAVERMFGYGTSELIGRDFVLLFPEFERGGLDHTLEHFLAGEGTPAAGAGREVTGRRRDGRLFPLEITVSEMTIGGLRYFTGVLRDLSARKQAEVEELKSGALQSAIFNSANFSSIATDAKGVIQIFNVGAERMLGYAADDVLNKVTPADISDPGEVIERAKTLSAELGTVITPGFEALVFKASRGIEDIYELTYIRKDGTRLPAVVSVTALRDVHNAIIGYLLIGTDNTARKEVEEERMKLDQRLRDQQFYTRSLIEANIDAIMTTDPSGIITDINKQMEALTGRTRDELIGAPFKNYFTDPERAEASIKRVLSERKVSDYELTALALDGKETIVSYNATTFYDRDRRLQGVFAAARDITERKRLDQVLREKNAELDQAGRLKDEFLANMSHELRTPLNAILGLSEALLEQVTGVLNARQVRSVTTISTSGAHLLTLINDILDLSKVESGMLELNPETLDTREFCESCLLFVRTQAVQKEIAIAFEHEGCLATFVADPKRLKQILVNLLTNAVKFTPRGGRIGLQVTAPEGADLVQFIVWDTGIGIAPEDEIKLFRAFSQVDSGLARAQEGTGLGLVLVAKLVELHGGGVTLESKAGEGSRFIVRLPQGIVLPSARETHPPIAPDLRHCRRALVIEDDPDAGAIMEKYLTELGLESIVQERGDHTIATVLRERPDVILLDIQLPGENGWTVLSRLKQHPVTRDIPVAIVTVLDEPEKSHALGAAAHFTKPITRAQLADFLQRETAGSAPSVPREAAPSATGGAVILLAEDNEANVQTIGGYLEDKGYAMRYACNGAVAVRLAADLRPALILMDIQMPVMDGLAAIEAIRTDEVMKSIPIVALTALAMPGDRERCLAAGATDYMSKPVSLKALAALIRRLLPAKCPYEPTRPPL